MRGLLSMVAALAVGSLTGAAYGTDVLCIYYPEWHVYRQGEEIFGKGRSEWDLVTTAKPRFDGHEQPVRLEAGCPDDSDPEAVAREIDLAAEAGITAFVYDWYWANGRPIQHEALERGFMMAPNRGKMKFALMWANHDRSDAFRPKPGKAAERFWWKLDWTGEEFLAVIRDYDYLNPMTVSVDGCGEADGEYAVYYQEGLAVNVPEDLDYEISGNNMDGFVIIAKLPE